MIGWEIHFARSNEISKLHNNHFACLFDNWVEPVEAGTKKFANCIVREVDYDNKRVELRIGERDMITLAQTVRSGTFLVSDEQGQAIEAKPGVDFPLVQALMSGRAGEVIVVKWV